MCELAYSLHLGSDKNKKNNARGSAKSNASGTTSLSNNAIQNARGLSTVDKHNYRKYDNDQENIEIIRGSSSLYEDVKNLYKKEFEESRLEYNKKQTRESRKIKDYFSHVSNNSKNDLACEIIIELGDKKYWDTKDMDFKKKMTNVFIEQVKDLELQVPNFKIASAIIHYDETSPHLHIVGVPIKYKNKNGMSKQVGKSNVFTKDSLRKLQDKMRVLCIESFNKEYHLNNKLKTKKKGRNKDYLVSEMGNYQAMKEQLEKNQKSLEKANKKSIKLDNSSKEIKEMVRDLKTTITSKDKYVLKKEDKEKLENYIDSVSQTNEEFKKVQTLSVTLNNVDEELKENKEKIKLLTQNNKALNLRVNTLTKNNKEKDKEIEELEKENSFLKNTIEYWKNKFSRLIGFIKNRLFNKRDQDRYYEFSKDLYTHGIITEDTMIDLKEEYQYGKEEHKKEKDDMGMSL